MKYKAAIFDMDGTVLDTLLDLTNSVNYALAKSGLPERTIDEIRSFVGNGIRLLIERAVPAGTATGTADKVLADFKEHYRVHCMDNTKPYDGIVNLLRSLKAAGIKTALVSNKADFAVQELIERFFDGCFDFAVGERSGVNRKPAPDMVWQALDKLGVGKADAVYIGDSDVDLETAKNAGLDCIAVSWGFRERDYLISLGAETVADDPDDIAKLIFPAEETK